MQDINIDNIFKTAARFDIDGTVLAVQKYGNGHINGTFLVTTDRKRYILQSINTVVFPDCERLMQNIVAVTEYLRSRGVETLAVIPTKDGETYLRDVNCRMYEYIENTVALQSSEDIKTLMTCGNAFGGFINALSGFDAKLLHDTIPNFHDTPQRFATYKKALFNDRSHRADTCKPESDLIDSLGDMIDKIKNGLTDHSIPLRVTHNDTKLNNILFDEKTGAARAVIDLDTVMSGSLLYDFGDAIRFSANEASEDERDVSKVRLNIERFKAYADGYLSAVKDSITEREIELMPYSAYLMTLECGIRFLTDYLDGDVYFATKYAEHNLVRCRTQLKLACDIQSNASVLSDIIYSLIKK